MLTPPGLAPLETACGLPFGGPAPSRGAETIGVFEALVRDLEPHAERGPLLVWVSGDDGTAIVAAAAVEAAKRVGARRPAAITPQHRGEEPDEYAGAVVRALGIEDWLRPDVTETSGLLGPISQDCLRRHGPMFPSLAYLFVPMLAEARGGTLVSGHSLHELWSLWRGAPLARLLRRRRPRPADFRALAMLAPLPLRRRLAGPIARGMEVPYQKPDARALATRLGTDDLITSPLRAGVAGQRAVARACVPTALTSYELLAADHQAGFAFAWGSPQVGAAIVHEAGWIAPLSPDAVRRQIAPALPARAGRPVPRTYRMVWRDAPTQAFIEEWDGTGLDDELIEPDALREAWRRGDWRSGMLLHSAWLHAQRA